MARGSINVANASQELPSNVVTYDVRRPAPLGNPFPLRQGADERGPQERLNVILSYRRWLRAAYDAGNLNLSSASHSVTIRSIIDSLTNSVLGGGDVVLLCNCKPLPCHADEVVILVEEIAARKAAEESSGTSDKGLHEESLALLRETLVPPSFLDLSRVQQHVAALENRLGVG